jgi:hypothetical protein
MFAVFDDIERVIRGFLKWQCRIFTTVFNRSFNCLPDGQKTFSIYVRNFVKKPNWLLENKENFNFERQL